MAEAVHSELRRWTGQRLNLAELAWLAAPDDPGIAEARHRVFSARADAATSTMARGIFSWAAREAQGDRGRRADGGS